MTRLGEGLLDLDDPPVKALVVYGANPMGSNPDQARVRRGLEREDLFTVVMEQFPTDTVDYADIVLPATMQTEHLDVNDGYGHMYVSLNRPAVEPPGECLSTTETFRRLARAMGLDRAVAVRRRRDAVPHAARRRPLRAAVGRGLDAARRTRAVRAVHGRLPDAVGQARVLRPRRRSPTASTRCPATRRRRSAEWDAEHPLALIAPASHWFLNTIFANKPDLMQRAGEPRDHAASGRRGQRAGSPTATTRACSTRAASSSPKVEVADRVRPGVVASTKGHWLKHVRGGANINATVEERDADMGGGADLSTTTASRCERHR